VQPDNVRRSGTLPTAEFRTESENRHLRVSCVQHRKKAVTIHQGAMTITVKMFIIVFGLASFLSFTVGQGE